MSNGSEHTPERCVHAVDGPDSEYILCEICGGRFEEGELMLDIPAIGWMHQNRKAPSPVDGPDWAGLREPTSWKERAIAAEAENAQLREANAGFNEAIGMVNFGAYPGDVDALKRWVADSVTARKERDALQAENEKLRQAQQEQWYQNDVELKRENKKLQARLDAMTVEWGYRDGLDGRVTVEDEEHARRIGQKYSDTYETVRRLVGPWTVVPEGGQP